MTDMKFRLQNYLTVRTFLALCIGVLTTLALGYNLELYTFSGIFGYALPNHAVTYDGDVHVHADFKMYIDDTPMRFTDAKYQSAEGHTLDASQHFHDDSDTVIHRHADGVTLVQFFASLGVTITDTCLILEDGIAHCTDKDNVLTLFVNNNPIPIITKYSTNEKDRILLYYGNPKNPRLPEYIASITDESCLYSHTCPERGEPPTESCGLTCDVANLFEQE